MHIYDDDDQPWRDLDAFRPHVMMMMIVGVLTCLFTYLRADEPFFNNSVYEVIYGSENDTPRLQQ